MVYIQYFYNIKPGIHAFQLFLLLTSLEGICRCIELNATTHAVTGRYRGHVLMTRRDFEVRLS